MDPTRRQLLAGGMAIAGLTPAAAAGGAAAGGETLPLWPGRPPGWRSDGKAVDHVSGSASLKGSVTGIAAPFLVVRRPAQPNGAAVILLPGGGYRFLSFDNEGESQAAWLTARGVTAFILMYRLPAEGWDSQGLVPLQDAQRAIRLVRSQAPRFGVDPGRVAVLGFSAGGHLAASLATRHFEPAYRPVDAADRLPARPDLAGLVYPVISMEAPFAHKGSRDHLLGPNPSPAALRSASAEAQVTADTPPVFLVHAADDRTVPVANSLSFHAALIAAGRPAELHVFEEGGHGFGVRLAPSVPASAWPSLFYAYGDRKGIFPGPAT